MKMDILDIRTVSCIVLISILCGCQSKDSTEPMAQTPTEPRMPTITKLDKNEVQPANDFAFAALRQLRSTRGCESFVFSPASLRLTLAMIASGATKASRLELTEAVYLDSTHEKQAGADLRMTSTLWSQRGIDVFNAAVVVPGFEANPDYIRLLKTNYQCEIGREDDVASINAFLKTQSGGKISLALDTLPPNLRMILISGLKFQSSWTRQFDAEFTSKKKFRRAKSTVEVEMMSADLTIPWIKNRQYSAAKIPMINGCSMIIFMPSMSEPSKQLDQSIVAKLMETSAREVRLKLPRWKTKTKNDLVSDLRKLKINRIFGRSAELERICSNEKLYVSHILQQASIEINEEGVEAKAEVQSKVMYKSIIRNLTFNEPFLYLIVRDSDQLILFSGQFCGE